MQLFLQRRYVLIDRVLTTYSVKEVGQFVNHHLKNDGGKHWRIAATAVHAAFVAAAGDRVSFRCRIDSLQQVVHKAYIHRITCSARCMNPLPYWRDSLEQLRKTVLMFEKVCHRISTLPLGANYETCAYNLESFPSMLTKALKFNRVVFEEHKDIVLKRGCVLLDHMGEMDVYVSDHYPALSDKLLRSQRATLSLMNHLTEDDGALALYDKHCKEKGSAARADEIMEYPDPYEGLAGDDPRRKVHPDFGSITPSLKAPLWLREQESMLTAQILILVNPEKRLGARGCDNPHRLWHLKIRETLWDAHLNIMREEILRDKYTFETMLCTVQTVANRIKKCIENVADMLPRKNRAMHALREHAARLVSEDGLLNAYKLAEDIENGTVDVKECIRLLDEMFNSVIAFCKDTRDAFLGMTRRCAMSSCNGIKLAASLPPSNVQKHDYVNRWWTGFSNPPLASYDMGPVSSVDDVDSTEDEPLDFVRSMDRVHREWAAAYHTFQNLESPTLREHFVVLCNMVEGLFKLSNDLHPFFHNCSMDGVAPQILRGTMAKCIRLVEPYNNEANRIEMQPVLLKSVRELIGTGVYTAEHFVYRPADEAFVIDMYPVIANVVIDNIFSLDKPPDVEALPLIMKHERPLFQVVVQQMTRMAVMASVLLATRKVLPRIVNTDEAVRSLQALLLSTIQHMHDLPIQFDRKWCTVIAEEVAERLRSTHLVGSQNDVPALILEMERALSSMLVPGKRSVYVIMKERLQAIVWKWTLSSKKEESLDQMKALATEFHLADVLDSMLPLVRDVASYFRRLTYIHVLINKDFYQKVFTELVGKI